MSHYFKHPETGKSIFRVRTPGTANGFHYIRFRMVYPGWQQVPLVGAALIEAMNLS